MKARPFCATMSNAIDDKDLQAFTPAVYYHLCAIAVYNEEIEKGTTVKPTAVYSIDAIPIDKNIERKPT